MDEVQFQKEVFKLRDQEYPYYYQVGLGSGFRVKGVKALIRWLTPSFSPSLPPPLLPEQQTTSARPAGPVRHVGRPLQPGLLQLHLLHPLEGARPIMCFARMECGRCLSIVRPINWSSWEDISLVHSRHRWPYLPLHIPSPEIPALTATLPPRQPCPLQAQVASRRLPTAELRSAFAQAYGRELLSVVWPEAETEAATAGGAALLPAGETSYVPESTTSEAGPLRGSPSSSPVGLRRASESAVLGLVVQLLDKLQAQGYVCRWVCQGQTEVWTGALGFQTCAPNDRTKTHHEHTLWQVSSGLGGDATSLRA